MRLTLSLNLKGNEEHAFYLAFANLATVMISTEGDFGLSCHQKS